jgi:hypothetical protein
MPAVSSHSQHSREWIVLPLQAASLLAACQLLCVFQAFMASIACFVGSLAHALCLTGQYAATAGAAVCCNSMAKQPTGTRDTSGSPPASTGGWGKHMHTVSAAPAVSGSCRQLLLQRRLSHTSADRSSEKPKHFAGSSVAVLPLSRNRSTTAAIAHRGMQCSTGLLLDYSTHSCLCNSRECLYLVSCCLLWVAGIKDTVAWSQS